MTQPLDEFGRIELHYAARDGDAALAGHLVSDGADVNLADSQGWTPLHFAAQASSASVVSLLLRSGATVDAVDVHGNTPLFRAVFSSRGEGSVISMLRGAGANPLACNRAGVSPAALAQRIGNYDVAQFFSDLAEDG